MGNNTGQAVFNVVGLIVGAVTENPYLGALISGVGQVAFPSGADVKGPHAQDQGFTTSTVGADIPIILGTQKCSGNIIWAGPLVEHKKEQSAKGGGPTATTYTATRSFSVLICEGPIVGIRRIWRNGKIVYDRTPRGDDESDADYRARDAANTKFETQLRIYLGTEDQLPDPLQEADKGVGKVPAYRGTAYVTFEDHDITDMGGRVPNFEFEVVRAGGASAESDPDYRQEVLAPWLSGSDPRACENEHEYRYGSGSWGTLDDALSDASLSNAVMMGWSKKAYGTGDNPVAPYASVTPGEQEVLYLHYQSGDISIGIPPESLRFDTVDAVSNHVCEAMKNAGLIPPLPPDVGTVIPIWWANRINDPPNPSTSNAPGIYYYAGGSVSLGIENPWVPGRSFITNCSSYWPGYYDAFAGWSVNSCVKIDTQIQVRRVARKPGTTCAPLCGEPKPLLPEDVRFCILDDAVIAYAGELQLANSSVAWKILVDPLPFDDGFGTLLHLPAIPDFDDRYSDADFWTAAAQAAIAKGVTLPASNPLVGPQYGVDYPVTKSSVTWKVLRKYTVSAGTVTKYPLGPAIPSFDSRYSSSSYWTEAYTQAKVVYGTTAPQGIPDGLVYNTDYPVTQSYAYARVPPDIRAVLSTPITLDEAVTTIAERCGLDASQLDTSALTETLTGIRVTSNTTGRAVIEQLMTYGYFDAVEVDGLLKFPLRGGAVVADLGEDDLGAHLPGEDTPPLVTLERAEPAELPRTLIVQYDDVDNEYQAGASPPAQWLTQDASSTQQLTLAIAMGSEKAAQIADVALAEIWWARESQTLAMMPQHLALAAGDAITVPLEGRTERVRITSTDMALPVGVIKASAVRSDASIYASYRAGVPVPTVTRRPTLIGPTDVLIVNVEPFRPNDTAPGFYVAAHGFFNGWYGCVVQVSFDDQATWTNVGSITNPTIFGPMVNTLASGRTSGTDDLNSVIVTLPSTDNLQSVTVDQLENANLAAVGSFGHFEAINFADHLDNGDGTRTLSTLLRGRLDTESLVASHVAGEEFVLLDDTLLYVPLSDSSINRTLYLRAVSSGQSADSALIIEVEIDDDGAVIIDGGGDDDDGGADDDDSSATVATLTYSSTLEVPISTMDSLSGSLYGTGPGKSIRQYDASTYALLSGVNVSDSASRLSGFTRIGTDFYIGAFFLTNELVKVPQTAVDTNAPGSETSYSAGAGQPQGLCVVGTDIWITLPYNGQLGKIDSSTMAITDTIDIYGQVITTDGTYLYIAGNGYTKCIQLSDKSVIWQSGTSQRNICHVLLDSGKLWVLGSDRLRVYDAATGAVLKSVPATTNVTGSGIYGGDLSLERRTMRSNGTYVLVAVLDAGVIYTRCYDPTTLLPVKKYVVPGVNCWIIGQNGSDVLGYVNDLVTLETAAETRVYEETP
ncbi:MAG TPA: phage tail protein [Steroidobacteraceae bacterium]|nr:phage tail protein [Steroidobacteraceae bacterium]